MRKFIFVLFVSAGFTDLCQAVSTPTYYNPPMASTITRRASMGIVGNFYVYASTPTKDVAGVFSSTGIYHRFGINVTTIQVQNLLTAVTAQFANVTVTGTITATQFSGPGISFTTNTSIQGLVISSWGADTNTIQSTIAFINIMGDQYFNITTMTALNKLGPGGLDTGSEAASKWYGIWAISNGSNMGIVFSDAGNVRPVLPTGYTKFRRIGWLYNDGSSNIVPFMKRGNRVNPFPNQLFINVANTPASAWSSVDMTSYISTTAYSAVVQANWFPQSAGTGWVAIRETSSTNYNGSFGMVGLYSDRVSNFSTGELTVPLFSNPQTWLYKTTNLGTGQLYCVLVSYEED